MPEFILVAILVMLVIVFAIIGLGVCLAKLFRGIVGKSDVNDSSHSTRETAQDTSQKHAAPKHSLKNDVQASRRLIDHLLLTSQITRETHKRMRGFLDKKFASELGSAPISPKKTRESGKSANKPAVENEPRTVGEVAPVETPDASSKPDSKPAPSVPEVPIAKLIPAGEIEVVSANVAEAPIAGRPATPAPWDRPDPPPRAPRRSFAEVMSVFMQEKNMRWGELTSGILIVLSAVGLVVSLRDQLSDAIPYFSSILFMMITAAIIAAGVYTLKKWKLRNTSRGTLVIGLLLIPLNFVAACVLSGGEERRELNDPWLWTAIIIGFGGFSALTWWAGKYLLRKQNWPLVAAIIGCGIGTLLFNRLGYFSNSSLTLLLLSLPVAAGFLAGAGAFQQRPWIRNYWSPRSTNRLLLLLGISTFAAITALSLLPIRAESTMAAAVAMTPVLVLISLVASWFGSIIRLGGRTSKSNNPMVGLTLQILGLILLGIFLLGSLANPLVFAVNCVIAAVGLGAIAYHQQSYRLLPIAWSVLTAGALAGLNLIVGNFDFDQWTTPAQLRNSLISGQSGLCLLVCGAGAAWMQTLAARRLEAKSTEKSLTRSGLITGGGIFLIGCLIALIASIVNRHDVFDTMTASLLLSIAGLGALVLVVLPISNRLREANGEGTVGSLAVSKVKLIVANLAGVLVLAALSHALLWNPTISAWFVGLTNIANANWTWVFAIHGLLFAAAVAWKRPGPDDEAVQYWSAASLFVAVVGAIWLVPLQTGVATILMLVTTVGWWLISSSLVRIGASLPVSIKYVGIPFVLATGILVAVAIGELGPRLFTWCPPIVETRHWLIQIIGLSGWAMLWTFVSATLHRDADTTKHRFHWLVSAYPRVDQVILHGLVFVLGGLLLTSLANGAFVELVRDSSIWFSLLGDQNWVMAALAILSLAMLFLFIEQPTEFKAAAIIVLWTLAWACGALSFEASISTASALRWLLPIGGLVAAVLIALRRSVSPGWVQFREGLKLQGPSIASDRSTQQLINFALVIVVSVVLLISTGTVSQVMINGVAALGGPAPDSWFGKMDRVVSFGVPLALLVSTFLVYAISERRPWLATAGSAVFQYMVVLAVVLLFLSPHPKLASEWFVSVLQSVSLGMTMYGFAWYLMRERIQPPVQSGGSEQSTATVTKRNWFSQIEIHTLINGLLITSLAVLVYVRFFFVPDQPADWINSVGRLLGVTAWILYAALAFAVWRKKLSHQHSTANWLWLTGWMGFVLVAMIAAIVDYNLESRQTVAPWTAFKILTAGTVVVTAVQMAILAYIRSRILAKNRLLVSELDSKGPDKFSLISGAVMLPLFLSSLIGLTFAVRGALDDGISFWFYVILIICVAILLFAAGLLLRRAVLTIVGAGVSMLATTLVVTESRATFSPNEPVWINLSVVVLLGLALLTLAFYLYQKRRRFERIRRSFLTLPNIVILLVPIWILAGALIQTICDFTDSKDSSLVNPLGITAILMMLALLVVSLWNDRRRFWVFAYCLTTLGIVIVCVSSLVSDDDTRAVGILFACSMTIAAWGFGWAKRAVCLKPLKNLSAPRLVAWRESQRRQLPVYSLILMSLLLVISLVAILAVEPRPLRYLVAAGPLAMAVGMGCLSDPDRRRWLQLVCLALVTLGCLFVGWADLTPEQIFQRSGLSILVRSLLVLAGAVFVFGGLITRWVRAGDSWLKSLRQAAAVICGWAILCLGLLITGEVFEFREDVGCGLTLSEAVSAAVVTVGMIVGLISIAVRPERDPFSFSLQGRQGYVYLAQLVATGLVAHLYFSMPWLFQIGIKEYWPYIAMAICFGGVGLAHLLEKRKLTVLGQPLFTTAAILPVLTAAGIFAIDSKADVALVLLTVGLAYLLISYTHRSALSGAAAILFGNLALWMFYDERFPQFSFFEHPQLWLIPPAISVLIAGQLNRKSLTTAQLAMLRYVCVAVIYVSSTSEIFISGLGDQLWPPMVLAALAVAGIMAGILLQVRSFLYLGSLFLLMAMITMVAHAHQRLDHVWPWWAFGITLGIAILVMFGMFEKKKNEMKEIAGRLKEWEV